MPAAARQVADRRVRLLVDAGRDEALERRAGLVDHPERGVARAGQRRGGLDDLLQQRVERQLGVERDAGVEQLAKATVARGLGHARKANPLQARCR